MVLYTTKIFSIPYDTRRPIRITIWDNRFVRTYIINNDTGYLPKLIKLLSMYSPEVLTPADLHDYSINPEDLVILSGSSKKSVANNQTYYRNELDLIRSHKGPLVGICLGMQLIASAYGFPVVRASRRIKGNVTINSDSTDLVLRLPSTLEVRASHIWNVPRIGPPLISLATSVSGVEILRHRELPHYGVQFHPEDSLAKDGRMAWNRIIEQLLM